MVAGGENPRPLNTAATAYAQTPYLANTHIPQQARFPIPSWRPRSGRNQDSFKWRLAVDQLRDHYGGIDIWEEPPAGTAIIAQGATRAQATALQAAAERELQAWLDMQAGHQHYTLLAGRTQSRPVGSVLCARRAQDRVHEIW